MSEKRAAARQRVLKAGTIVFNRAGGISCTIRNMSESGACLEVASLVGIPTDFTLLIEKDDIRRPSRRTWAKGNRMGVVFL